LIIGTYIARKLFQGRLLVLATLLDIPIAYSSDWLLALFIITDFLDVFYEGFHWPAFNVADSCITTGVGFMIYDLFFGYPENTRVSNPPNEPV